MAKDDGADKRALKHGLYAIEHRGEAALSETGRTRLQELRDQFMSEPGRVEYRQELAAHIALILELGWSHMREITENGGKLWDSAPIARMGTYLNTLARLLDSWPKDSKPQDITSILEGKSHDTD